LHPQVADHFEDYGERENDFATAAEFFKQKFISKCKKQKTIFTHYTVATDKVLNKKLVCPV